MFKVGEYYITNKGRLVKILSNFKFQDGWNVFASVFVPGTGWGSLRYREDGACSVDDTNNRIVLTSTYDTYLTFLNYQIQYDRATALWKGQALDPFGALIVSLTNIEDQERTLKLLQLGASEKLLTWMQESGYINEMDEGAE